MIQWLLRTTWRVKVSTDDAPECLEIRISFVPKNVLRLSSGSGASRVGCVLQECYYIAHDMPLIRNTHRHGRSWAAFGVAARRNERHAATIAVDKSALLHMPTMIHAKAVENDNKRARLSADLAEDLIKFLIIHIMNERSPRGLA